MKRLTRAALLSLLLLGGAASAVHAGDEWCDTDPGLVIKTPAGSTVVLHLTNGALGSQHTAALQQAAVSYVATPAQGGASTDVAVTVLISPDSAGIFGVRSTVSSDANGGGTVYDTETGISGTPMVLSFRLSVP